MFRHLYAVLSAPVRQWQHFLGIGAVLLICGGPVALAGGFTAPGGTAVDSNTPPSGTYTVTGAETVTGTVTGGVFVANGSAGPAGSVWFGTSSGPWVNAISGQSIFLGVNNSAVLTLDVNGMKLVAGATKSRGTITLSGGTGTATVNSGAICTCADTTAANACKTSVSSTTLTITGTTTDVIAYICL